MLVEIKALPSRSAAQVEILLVPNFLVAFQSMVANPKSTYPTTRGTNVRQLTTACSFHQARQLRAPHFWGGHDPRMIGQRAADMLSLCVHLGEHDVGVQEA